jgi:exopolysaccharide biosynthesis polyprenyl glycosylphosphotransferase
VADHSITLPTVLATSRSQARMRHVGLTAAVAGSELVMLLAGTLASQLLRFGTGPSGVDLGFIGIGYAAFSIMLSIGWFLTLQLMRIHRPVEQVLAESGHGFADLTRSTIIIALGVATYSAITQTEISRGYLLAAIPLCVTLLVINRSGWRAWLRAKRRAGQFVERAVIVGAPDHVESTAALIANDRSAGLSVAARITANLGAAHDNQQIVRAVEASAASVVIIVGGADRDDESIRELMWTLESLQARVLVVPHVGPMSVRRVRSLPVGRTPFIVIDPVDFSGPKYALKRGLDIAISSLAIALLSPLLIAIAITIRIDSSGPALFLQRRIGRDGREFTMFKFRSMRTGADLERTQIAHLNDYDGGVLFKMRNDPRVTRIGKHLRRFSLDELPQLFNVLGGSMSLVGPRPPLPDEVATYQDHAFRRLMAKPGITGPWQVSGRSDLSWEEGLVLDVMYVENWSVAEDISILMRTAQAVVNGKGAY